MTSDFYVIHFLSVRIELLKNEGDFGDIDFLDGFMQFKYFFCSFVKLLGYNCVFLFPSLDFALNCQVCQKYGAGICETAEDNGVSMECPPDLNACWYIYEGKDHKAIDEIIFRASNYRGPG